LVTGLFRRTKSIREVKMPLKSRFTVDVPDVVLPTFLFGSPKGPLPVTPLLMDARAPETHYLSLSTYRLWCQRVAAGLLKHGLKKGDRVLLFSGNTIFFPVVIVGTIMAGGIFTGANPTYVPRELAYQLKDSGATFLICAEAALDTGLEAAKQAGLPRSSILVFDDGFATVENRGKGRPDLGVKHWTWLLASEDEGRAFIWDELDSKRIRETTVTLNYSSGTTGIPKGVEITARNYIANAVQMEHRSKQHPEYEEMKKRARHLCFLPMYHAMAQTIFGINAMKNQIPVYLMPKFDFEGMLECVQKYRITDLTLVPPIVVAMAKDPRAKKYDLSSVETVGAGAAPLGREVCVEFEKLWPPGKVNVVQGWGMTEITCSAVGWPAGVWCDSSSVGELNANVEAKLVDDDGKEITKRGERGEVWLKGPNVMKGYWRRPDATKETITEDGWLKTGDIAYIDEKNHFFIVDRKKELIKVKGNQVAPAELEAILLDHPAVADAAVIGVTINHDEHPRAYIVLAQGKKATEKDIQEFMKKHVTRTKWLTGGVRFVQAIPKNPVSCLPVCDGRRLANGVQ
jgi:4-coumarate--CoA ligase